MLASLFSKPQPSLSVQAKRLVAMRFLIYTGFQTSYFIGVIGSLTYADDASVVATSLAVLFMNVFVILGSFAGGAALDAWGPRRHFLLSIVGTLTTGAAILIFWQRDRHRPARRGAPGLRDGVCPAHRHILSGVSR